MPIQVTPSLALDEREFEERFVRASGPGGQNVNKVATAVELRFDLARSALPQAVKDGLRRLAGSRLTAEGVLVVEAREHRTQARNREAARQRLIELIRRASRPPRVRRPTRPTAAARVRRLDDKRQQSARKRARRQPGDE
jgi:ribosome-associated protein